jgi:hypothetical protein
MTWFSFNTMINDYWGIVPSEPIQAGSLFFPPDDFEPEAVKAWMPPRVKLAKEGRRKRGDFPCYSSFPPILGQRALSSLRPLLSHCDLLPLVCDEEPLVALNAPMLRGALDVKLSEVEWFEEGKRAMLIHKFVFRGEEVKRHPVFRIPERVNLTILSEAFRDAVAEHKLKGIRLEQLDAIWKA